MKILQMLEAKREAALGNPNKAIRIRAGYYFFFNGTDMIEIEKLEHDYEGSTAYGQWIARDMAGKWHSDPVDTMAQAIEGVRG